MSLKEQDKLEDRQESFSFSNYDCSSSSIGVVLSDGEDSDESYIEIELERAKSYRTHGGDDIQSDGEDSEIELRISISSHTPFARLSIPSFSRVTDDAESGSSQSSSSTTCSSTSWFWSKARDHSKKAPKSEGFSGGRRGVAQFPAVSRLLSMLISRLKVPPEICQENNVACSSEKQDEKTEMPCARKPSSKTRTTMSGGIMKFFIKLRAMQAKALLAPLMKTPEVIAATDPKGKKRTSGRERKQKLEETLGFYWRTSAGKSAKNSPASASASSSAVKDQCSSKSSSVQMNSKKSAADALNRGRFERTSSPASCPSSIRCSPLHAGENSIQAAIAHCKSSFAPFPGFYF